MAHTAHIHLKFDKREDDDMLGRAEAYYSLMNKRRSVRFFC